MTNGNTKSRCKHNLGVLCDCSECRTSCGWHPAEHLRRHTQFRRDGFTNFGNETYGLKLKHDGEELAG